MIPIARGRGRVAALAVGGAVVLLGGCERKDQKEIPPATRARSAAVASRASAVASVTAAPAPSPSAPPRARRTLCDGDLERPGKAVPEVKIARQAAPGASPVAERLPIGGQWTWLNFWAAWCVPCKEEIPRLLSWEQKLNAVGISFQVAFVSLDDDARQLAAFLASEPTTGLRQTFWLDDLDRRQEWLDKVGIGRDPELPEHLLIDPKGKIRCVIEGAVDDADYDRVRQLIAG